MTDQEEIERYSRHFLLRGWGEAEQTRIRSLGGIVSSEAEVLLRYLAGAGIGRLALLGSNATLEEELRKLRPDLELGKGHPEKAGFIAVFAKERGLLRDYRELPAFEIPEHSPAGQLSPFPHLSSQARVANDILRKFSRIG